MNITFAAIIFGGLAAVYIVSNIAESMIRKGAAELDRDTLDKVWRREAQSTSIWKTTENLAFILLLLGLIIIFRVIKLGAFWGYGTLAGGMATFCFASILRAWMSHAAYAAEAPNTNASSGARTGAVLTTLAECILGGAVCFYVFTHVSLPPSLKNLASSSPPANTATSTSTGTGSNSTSPTPPQNSEFVGQTEAVKLLGKDVKFLKALADHGMILSRGRDDSTEYNREDIARIRHDGYPSNEELGLDGDSSQK